jgi:hypothetical protein
MGLFVRPEPGPRLTALLEARKPIEDLYEPWVQGEQIDRGRLQKLHDAATLAAHAFYVESIPIYARLAEELGLAECDDAEMIRTELASTDHVFKSYPQEWIDNRDFASLTDWAGQVVSDRPKPDLAGVATVEQWLKAMHASGWRVNYSSGTSGHLSFGAREQLTVSALEKFTVRQWTQMAGHTPYDFSKFDGYFMVFAGGYQMLSYQGHLLSQQCASAQFMYPEPSDADLTRLMVRGARTEAEEKALAQFRARTGGSMDAHGARILDGMIASARAGRPILLYAPPFQLLDLCQRMEARGERIAPQPLAALLTGGGWKSFEDQRIAREELLAYAEDRLGFQPHQMHEGYGQSECNSHFNRCAHGRFHATPLSMPLVFDANGDVMPKGGVGRYGFSDPFITSYPGFVISGDEVELVDERCPCGLTGPAIIGEIRRAKGQEMKGCGGVMAATRA